MEISCFGFLMLDYKPNKYKDYDKYKDFHRYVEFKKNIDQIFIANDIYLEKIYQFMTIMEEFKLQDEVYFQLEFKYTKEEIEQSSLFSMATYYDILGTSTKFPNEYGTKYTKQEVCPHCGSIIYQQATPLYWNTAQMKKKLLMEIPDSKYRGSYAMIITERLANIFQKQGFTGYSLAPVIHVGNKEKEKKCFQMIIHHTMPPLSERMPYTINEDVCKVCAPKGNFVFPLYYDKISLDCLEAFNLAHEMKMAPFT